MNEQSKTNAELIEKISVLEQKIKELEQMESARKRVEEALRKSEERYRTLVENATDLVFRTDNTGCLTFVNPATLRITGYEEKEIIGKQYTMVIRPDMRDEAMKFFGRQFVKGIQNTYSEYPMLTKDGQEVWFGQNTQLIVEDGNVTGFQVMARDITDRKRIEGELRDSEERYRRIIEASSDAVLLRSKDIVIYANPAALKLFRANHPGDLIGKRYLDLVHPDDRAISTERVKKTLDENWIASPREHRILAMDGQVVHVESTGVPVKYRGEAHIFGIFRDITDRKRAEEALRESQAFYHSLVEQLPAGVFRKDREGRYVFVSLWFCRLKGMKEEEFLGKTPQEVVVSEAAKPTAKEQAIKYATEGADHHVRIMQTGNPIELVEEYTDAAGRKQFVHVIKIPVFNSEGKVIGTQGVLFDITDHKRMEEALRESENRYRELSIVDDLTQLYNSRHFYFQLKIELDRSNRYEQPLTLLLLDLDNFKAFNDAYGHVEGDQVLLRLGRVVKRCLRETDFAFRYGGEEFTIILPMTTSADGAVTAERIRTEFKKETFSPAPGQDVHVTVSIGLAQYKPQEDMKAFVHRVDQLMYQGKNNGKDRVCSGS